MTATTILTPLTPAARRRGRGTFLLKIVLAALLLATADVMAMPARGTIGAMVGLYALLWLGVVAVARRVIWRSRPATLALAAAFTFALLLVNDPGLLAFALFVVSIAMTTLLPRASRFGDARIWLGSLILGSMVAPLRLLADMARTVRFVRFHRTLRLAQLVAVLIVPVVGSAIFLALFANANPIIEAQARALASLDLFALFREVTPIRIIFWGLVLVPVWSTLRPSRFAGPFALRPHQGPPRPTSMIFRASTILSLVSFNIVFALQNGLDIAFLWSGAPLPDSMTLADYAHRGAYPLILTALLAAVFVLATLRPGTDMAADNRIKALVALWIGQNIFLVASAIDRTATYVVAYQLTLMRLAALIWMGLVAVGLALIVWRILANRTNTWLVNSNALAALVVLTACSAVDLSECVADWNVSRQIEAGPDAVVLDTAYLFSLDRSSTILPLLRAEHASMPAALRLEIARKRPYDVRLLMCDQSDWRGWTWRGARRLHAVYAAVADLPGRSPDELQLGCDGGPSAPAKPAVPLTLD